VPPELWALLTLNINKLPAQEAFLVDAHPSPNHLIGGSRLRRGHHARGYPPEFRARVIELVETGRPVIEIAADLEISPQG
jgi:hypothetical protein